MRARPGDVVDLFVYVVVLNLAIEYVPSVISEGFTLPGDRRPAQGRPGGGDPLQEQDPGQVPRRHDPAGRLVAALSLWVVAAGSKLVVLWLVDLGDSVSLGGFIPVTLLVVALWRHGTPYAVCSTTARCRRPGHGGSPGAGEPLLGRIPSVGSTEYG